MRMLLACLLLCGLQISFAQKRPLIIGERIPDDRVIRLKDKSTLILSELKGKPVIIDLFSSSCVVCFQMLPKLNKLQEQFMDGLQLLLLGCQDSKIERIYQKFEERLQLTMQVGFDSLFFKKFEVGPLPMYIWLRSNGTIAAITGPDEVTAANIELLIANRELPFAAKPERVAFDYFKPYLLNGNGGPDNNFFVRSLIGPWNPAQSFKIPGTRAFSDSGHVFNVIGVEVGQLYNYAYWGRIDWGVRDTLYGKAWLAPILEKGEALPNQRYCYSVSYNGDRVPDLAVFMQKDLEGYFGYEARIETREMPCYVLRLRKPGLLRSKLGKPLMDVTHAGFTLKNRQVRHLRQLLAMYNTTDIPFLDETGIDYAIDLSVDGVLTNQVDFFQALEKQGILITEELRAMKVLVLRAKKDVAATK